MKLFLSIIALLPTFAIAAATKVSLKLSDEMKSGDNKMCMYFENVNVGSTATITPFQFMVPQDDGSYLLQQRPNAVFLAKNGQFFVKVSTISNVKLEQTCPAQTTLILVQ